MGLAIFLGVDTFLVSPFSFSVELSFLKPCLTLSDMPDLSFKMSDFFSEMSDFFSEMSEIFSESQHFSRCFSVLALKSWSSLFFVL